MNSQQYGHLIWFVLLLSIALFACSDGSSAKSVADALTDRLDFENGEKKRGLPPDENTSDEYPQTWQAVFPEGEVQFGEPIKIYLYSDFDKVDNIKGAVVYVDGAKNHIVVKSQMEAATVDDGGNELEENPDARWRLIADRETNVVRLSGTIEQDERIAAEEFLLKVAIVTNADQAGNYFDWDLTVGELNEAEPMICEGDECTDPATNLVWMKKATNDMMSSAEADLFCDELELGEYTNWRLPTINDLRSLIRGCHPTLYGSDECLVTNECTSYDNCQSFECKDGYVEGYGPGKDGCYWDRQLKGDCDDYLSSTPLEENDEYAWMVKFTRGAVVSSDSEDGYVRCVRGEL